MKFLKATLVLMLIIAAFAAHAQPPSSNELKKKKDELTKELDRLNQEYEQTANNKRATLAQLNILKQQIRLREEKIDNINSQIRNLDNEIDESNHFVHSLQGKLDLLKKQ